MDKGGGIAAYSDSSGQYIEFDIPTGTRVVAIHCPTKRIWMGRVVTTRTISVASNTDSVLNFFVTLRGCDEPPLRDTTVELSGHYVSGFETSMFKPCALFPEKFQGTAYEGWHGEATVWVEWTDKALGGRKWPDVGKRQNPEYYVRWRGTLSGPGSFGHLGFAGYQLLVKELITVRIASKQDCQ